MNEKEIGTKKIGNFYSQSVNKTLKGVQPLPKFFSIFELEIQIFLTNFRGQNDSECTFKLHQACGI